MTAPVSRPAPFVHSSHWVLAIDPDADAVTALGVMRDNGVRHLPVVRGARCEGLLTESDLLRVLVALPDGVAVPTVAQLCHREPPTVADGAPLATVAAAIMAGGLDAALVVQRGVLTAIVTSVDVIAAVAER